MVLLSPDSVAERRGINGAYYFPLPATAPDIQLVCCQDIELVTHAFVDDQSRVRINGCAFLFSTRLTAYSTALVLRQSRIRVPMSRALPYPLGLFQHSQRCLESRRLTLALRSLKRAVDVVGRRQWPLCSEREHQCEMGGGTPPHITIKLRSKCHI